jgi:3-deoxy-D-manno-octulosonic-acid transferase
MTPAAARRLYTLGWYFALPWVVVYLLARSVRQPEYQQFWRQRFLGRGPVMPSPSYPLPQGEGRRVQYLPSPAPAGEGPGVRAPLPIIWLHAVSVGETRAAQPLIERLARAHPEAHFVLTHMTPTGRAAAEPLMRSLPGRIIQRYLPYDLPLAVRRFVSEARPSIGVLLETEIWPNLQFETRRAGVPMVLVNARLSERSLARAQRWPSLMRSAAAGLAAVAAQTQADRGRWKQLYDGPISITGNLKFDADPAPAMIETGRALRRRVGARPVWMFASTREGEERLILDALASLSGSPDGVADPRPVLLFVPRHPQRFDEVARALSALGRPVLRREGFEAISAQTSVLLGDSMGEMPMYYAMADVALIGGSLLPLGGQNLIEACACGCPVVFGPHMFNFAQAVGDALSSGCALQVNDALSALHAMRAIACDPERRDRMSQAALAFAQAHRGATERTVELIGRLLALPLTPGPTSTLQ